MIRMTPRVGLLLCISALDCASLWGCTSSTAPPPDPALVTWTEACVRLSGCEPYASHPTPMFACQAGVSIYASDAPAQCALEATTCDAAVGCVGGGSAPPACPGGTDARCEGDVLHRCDPALAFELARDCAAEGLTCRINDFGDAHCAQADACTTGRCDGDVPVQCFGGTLVPQARCASGRCVADNGFPTCAGEGDPCNAPVFECDGDVAVTCQGGFLHREQCRPGACRTDDGARCVSTDECMTRCEGTSVVRCVGAEIVRDDCTAWGFSTCTSEVGEPRCE